MKNTIHRWLDEFAVIAGAVAVLGLSTTLHADQIVQTVSTLGTRSPFNFQETGSYDLYGGLPAFSLFDPEQGTLNSITIVVDGHMAASIWVENATDDPFGVSVNPEVSITVIGPDGALLAPGGTDTLRNTWGDGDHLEPGQSVWLNGPDSNSAYNDNRTASYTLSNVNPFIFDPTLLDEHGDPISLITLGLSVQDGAQGTFIPDASSLPVAYWFNEGDHREIFIYELIEVTLIYDYTPF